MNERIKQILTSPALVRLRDWSGIGPVQRRRETILPRGLRKGAEGKIRHLSG